MAQLRYLLNSQALVIFFPFATIPATSHYPIFTDRHSLQYGMLTILLHFITNTFFLTFLPLSPPPSASTLFLNHTASPIPCTPPSLNPLTKKTLVIPPPSSPSHSPDLGCVGAQRIILLGRFLVYPSHLLSVGPRLARMWLILNIAKNKCFDSENQGTIDNSL